MLIIQPTSTEWEKYKRKHKLEQTINSLFYRGYLDNIPYGFVLTITPFEFICKVLPMRLGGRDLSILTFKRD